MAGKAAPEQLSRDAISFCKAAAAQVPGTARDLLTVAEEALAGGDKEDGLRKAVAALGSFVPYLAEPSKKKLRDQAAATVAQALSHFQELGDRLGEADATRVVAKLSLTKHRPEGAIKAALQAADLFRSSGSKKGQAASLLVAVDAHVMKGKDALEGKFVRQGELLKLGEQQKRAKLRELANEHFASGASQAREVSELFRQVKDKRGQAEVQTKLAEIGLDMSDAEEAKEAAQTARDLYNDLEDIRGQSAALLLEVDAHVEGGDGVEALGTAEEVVKIFRKANDKKGEAEGLFACMKVQFMRGEFSEMMKLGKEARELLQRVDGGKLESMILDTILQAYVAKEDTTAAISASKDCMELQKRQGDKLGEAHATHTCACLIMDKFFSDYKEYQQQFKQKGFINDGLTPPDHASYEEGLDLVEHAYALFEELQDKEGMEMATETIINIDVKVVMLNEPDIRREILKGQFRHETIEEWNSTDVKLSITRDGGDYNKIKKSSYRYDPEREKPAELLGQPAIGNVVE